MRPFSETDRGDITALRLAVFEACERTPSLTHRFVAQIPSASVWTSSAMPVTTPNQV